MRDTGMTRYLKERKLITDSSCHASRRIEEGRGKKWMNGTWNDQQAKMVSLSDEKLLKMPWCLQTCTRETLRCCVLDAQEMGSFGERWNHHKGQGLIFLSLPHAPYDTLNKLLVVVALSHARI